MTKIIMRKYNIVLEFISFVTVLGSLIWNSMFSNFQVEFMPTIMTILIEMVHSRLISIFS